MKPPWKLIGVGALYLLRKLATSPPRAEPTPPFVPDGGQGPLPETPPWARPTGPLLRGAHPEEPTEP